MFAADQIKARQNLTIELGARSLGAVEVLTGLTDGDAIISSSIEAFEGAETVLITN